MNKVSNQKPNETQTEKKNPASPAVEPKPNDPAENQPDVQMDRGGTSESKGPTKSVFMRKE